MMKPHFEIKNKFQKRNELYENIITKKILRDICKRLTGKNNYTVNFDNSGYNIGRLATLEYDGKINYISFSESNIRSRNSFFQSFTSALVQYYQEANTEKNIYFYFLEPDKNIETNYFIFMYRLMKTAGTVFLNEAEYLTSIHNPFNSVYDIILWRDSSRGRNKGNASSYVTVDDNDVLQIYGKTYGANKYETSLLCLAIHEITPYSMELYEIPEGDLKKLPTDARNVISSLNIKVITSDEKLERQEYESNDSLRSPTYIYNLLKKLGEKKCSLCDCEIPQIIQGAHILPVACIKRMKRISKELKLKKAIDGDNGLWLCNNHHKLFDINLLYISTDGRLKYKTDIEQNYETYLRDFTIYRSLPPDIMTDTFKSYLKRRNSKLDARQYIDIS